MFLKIVLFKDFSMISCKIILTKVKIMLLNPPPPSLGIYIHKRFVCLSYTKCGKRSKALKSVTSSLGGVCVHLK